MRSSRSDPKSAPAEHAAQLRVDGSFASARPTAVDSRVVDRVDFLQDRIAVRDRARRRSLHEGKFAHVAQFEAHRAEDHRGEVFERTISGSVKAGRRAKSSSS